MTSAPIAWNPALNTGNESIDSQHRHLFEVFEQLRGVAGKPDKLEESAVCISEMMHYLKTHFRDEEAYMLERGYADLERHKALHAEFAAKAADYADACGSGYAPYADMLEYLVTWLSEHIMGEDMKFVGGK